MRNELAVDVEHHREGVHVLPNHGRAAWHVESVLASVEMRNPLFWTAIDRVRFSGVRVLVVGAGGVVSAVGPIARRRSFFEHMAFEHMVFAD